MPNFRPCPKCVGSTKRKANLGRYRVPGGALLCKQHFWSATKDVPMTLGRKDLKNDEGIPISPKLQEVFNKFGLEVNWVDDLAEVPMWDGTKFNFRKEGYASDECGQAFHELMHWVMASDEEKQMPDYGLGLHIEATETQQDPEGLRPKRIRGHNQAWGDELVMSSQDAQQVEEMVCDLFPIYMLIDDPDDAYQLMMSTAYEFSCLHKPRLGVEKSVGKVWGQLQQIVPEDWDEEETVRFIEGVWAQGALWLERDY